MLLDTHARLGLGGLAQVNLGVRKHRNRNLLQLGVMARQILAAALHRCGFADSAAPLTQFLQVGGEWLPTSTEVRRDGAAADERAATSSVLARRPAALIPIRATWWDRRMGTALIYLLVVVAVAAAVFGLASAVFGRGEELAPLPPGATPTRLPVGDVGGDDVRALRFQQAVRGYRMAEVDWVLDRLATELDRIGAERDDLRARLAEVDARRRGAVRRQ